MNRLREQLPYVSLGRFPTPVERLAALGRAIGVEQLYIKRDDLSGDSYGGNKVRKLEFLLGDALRVKAREVITFGFAGSNHSLATAYYAKQLGLKCTALLLPQVNAHYVRRNLLASFHQQTELHHYATPTRLRLGLLGKLWQSRRQFGVWPRLIPPGGSCPLGAAGYVNAALELNDQIAGGAMPVPARIYVPLGSMGTAAGLILGLAIAGLNCEVAAVRVIEERLNPPRNLHRLLQRTDALLRRLDPATPRFRWPPPNLILRSDCLGDGYGRFTGTGIRAAVLMQRHAGIPMNGTYSAKAFAALLADAANGTLAGKTILFWNTYNSRDLAAMTADADYRQLPTGFHRYFESDVQPLDR
ncbi:MAG: pyridoxal-phosphate dependent enzyme [Verrucomicrobiia bacterium]|jgi:D-cysteine desulfhydrase